MSIKDIGQWIDNDEGLYNWWKSTKKSKTAFIKENRQALENLIIKTKNGEKQVHHLAYGPETGMYPS